MVTERPVPAHEVISVLKFWERYCILSLASLAAVEDRRASFAHLHEMNSRDVMAQTLGPGAALEVWPDLLETLDRGEAARFTLAAVA